MNIQIGTFKGGEFYGNLTCWIPYLGKTESIWDIALIKDGSKLLSHKLWNKEFGEYIVLGPNDEELEFITDVKLPYGPPYGDFMNLKRMYDDLEITLYLRKPDKKAELNEILKGLKENANEIYKIWRLQNTDSERKFNSKTGRYE